MKKLFFLAATLFACVAMYGADIANAIPEGWTYISNDPDKYPDPSYYKDGGIKMNFPGIGIQSPEFAPTNETVNIYFTIKLNKNQKNNDGNDAKSFTAYGLNANGDVVAEKDMDVDAAGDWAIPVLGPNIVAIRLIMTAYPTDGESFYNANLLAVSVDGVDDPEPVDPPTPELDQLTVADAVAAIEAMEPKAESDKEYIVKGIIKSIAEVSVENGNATFDIVDKGGNAVLTVFRCYFLNGDKFSAEDQIWVGAEVEIQGKLKSWQNNDNSITPELTKGKLLSIEAATGIEDIEMRSLDLNAPMFNVLGQQVDASFRGVVIQNGKKYILR
ncbi:MAG: hypothetical protein IJ756_00640 [Paludibacteraceae bacterium]|nr:hypothetical protein [Paludibacteraceae bacterium]